jgi:hypothetical protein
VGAEEPGRHWHSGVHQLHEMGSLKIQPRVVVGSPSNVVSVTDLQVLVTIGTYCINTGLCVSVYNWVFPRGQGPRVGVVL